MNQLNELEQGIAAWLGDVLTEAHCPRIECGTRVPDEGIAVAAVGAAADNGAFCRCRIRVDGSFAERAGALQLAGIGERELPRFGAVFGTVRLAALLLHAVEENGMIQRSGSVRHRVRVVLEAVYQSGEEVQK